MKANNPIVIEAAKNRARILASLGLVVDEKTARIASRKTVERPPSDYTDTAASDLPLVSDVLKDVVQQAAQEAPSESQPRSGKFEQFVIYSKYGGHKIKARSGDYIVLRAKDLLVSNEPTQASAETDGKEDGTPKDPTYRVRRPKP
ncbi:hypothetical protein [Pseudarthrobacter polychromogenes]|nr:hypothetical protein [Pseudarthrobacter polychromogenes]